jgi:hypothetical protein
MTKRKLQYICIIVFASLFIPFALLAQRGPLRNSRFYRGQSNYGITRATFGGGTSTYFGDLCESGDCLKARPQFSLGYNFRYTGKFSVRGEFTYFRLFGTDVEGKNARRNLSFRSGNVELSGAVVYDFFQYTKFYNRRQFARPYVFAGFGLIYTNPKAELNDKWYSLRPLKTEGVEYARIQPVIPYGGGVTFKLSPWLDFSVEMGYRWLFTDYLDDVSTTFVNNSSLPPIAAALADRSHEVGVLPWDTRDGRTWAEGHQRGDPKQNDGYVNVGFKVEYTINPVIRPKTNVWGKTRKPRFGAAKRGIFNPFKSKSRNKRR